MSLTDLTTRPHLVWGKLPYFDTDPRVAAPLDSSDWGELTQQRVQRAYMSSLLSQRSAVLDSREQSLNSRSTSLRAMCGLLEAHMATLDHRASALVSISNSLDTQATSVDTRLVMLDEYVTRLDHRARTLDETAGELKDRERKLVAEENRLTSKSTQMDKREAELLDREHRLARGEASLEDKRKRFDAMRQLHRASADSTFAKVEARTRFLDAREETLSHREHMVKQREGGKPELGGNDAMRTGRKIPPLDTSAPPAPGLTPPATPCAITESLSAGSDGVQELASVEAAAQYSNKSTCPRALGNGQVKDSDSVSPSPKRSSRKETEEKISKLRAWPELPSKRADTRKTSSSIASAAMSSSTSVASSASWHTVPSTSDEAAPAASSPVDEEDTWQFTPGPPRGAVRPRPLTDEELVAYCGTLGSVWTYSRNELNSTEKQAIPVLGTSWSQFIPWNKAMETRLGMAKGLASALRHRLATLRIEEHVSAPRRRRYVLPEEEARLIRATRSAST